MNKTIQTEKIKDKIDRCNTMRGAVLLLDSIAEQGLTLDQARLMLLLMHESKTSAWLSCRLGISLLAVVGMLGRLGVLGLVVVARHTRDSKALTVYLTPMGLDKVELFLKPKKNRTQ